MDFSIVVPFFNAEKFIGRCIQGLMAQTVPACRYEILLVDNNSQDSSSQVAAGFKRVRVLREAEQGSYAARNRGVAEARGNIVAFTDPDCVPREDWLEQIGRAMKPGAQVLLGDRLFASDSGILGQLAAYETGLIARIFQSEQVEFYYGYTNNMAVTLSALKELGGFRKLARGADTLLLRRAAYRYGSSAVKYIPEMLVRHLEIASIRDYLQKKAVYGQLHGDPNIGAIRPLPLAARCELALRASRRHRCSAAGALGFFSVLAAGAIRFEWERWRDAAG